MIAKMLGRKLKALRTERELGGGALERGAFVEIDDADLASYLEGFTATPSKG